MPAARNSNGLGTLDHCLKSLHEVPDVSVYDAIERLVWAGEEVGIRVEDMNRMLDRGMSLSALLVLIESKMQWPQQ